MLRSLIDGATLVPEGGALAIELQGDVGAMLGFAADKRRSPRERGDLAAQASLVAGACKQRFLRLAESRIPRLAA